VCFLLKKAKLNEDESVELSVIESICDVLACHVEDVVEIGD
jgi:DNA-binding Xre family transcriptional regulator